MVTEIFGTKIEKPDTLFGKHTYFQEQALWNNFMYNREKALAFINPILIATIDFPIDKIVPKEKRFEKVREHLCKAKKSLEDIGL